MSNFSGGFHLTQAGLDLRSKMEAGGTLTYTTVKVGSGSLPPDGAPFAALAAAEVVTVYNQETGVATDASDGDAGVSVSVTTQGAADAAEVAEITVPAGSALSGGNYFKIHTPSLDYHVWYKVDGNGADPAPADSVPIMVEIEALDSDVTVASKTTTAIDQHRTGLADLARIINWIMDAEITGDVVDLGNGEAQIPIRFSNELLTEEFYLREIAVYADDPDLGVILYCVANAGEQASFVPAMGGTPYEFSPTIQVKIGSVTDVAVMYMVDSEYVHMETYSVHLLDKKAHRKPWTHENANFSLAAQDRVCVDTTSNEVEAIVPDSPAVDDYFLLCDIEKQWDTNNLKLKQSGSGEKIEGETEVALSIRGMTPEFTYLGTARGWVLTR